MASPLFVTDTATLKARLRLSDATQSDALAILDEAVLRARVRFFRVLGDTRINQLLAVTFTDTPTTDEQAMRALASVVEVKMVYCTLMRLLPNAFIDSAGGVLRAWNEEAPVRERGVEDLEDEIRRCEREIASDLVALADDSFEDGCEDVQVFDGTADCPAPRIGQTLRLSGESRVFPSHKTWWEDRTCD